MHAFVDEIVLTAILVLGIFAITEEFNTVAPQANSGALIIGLLVAAIGASAGYLEAWAINPARDLGPRLFAWIAGWGAAALAIAGQLLVGADRGPASGRRGRGRACISGWSGRSCRPGTRRGPATG